MGRLRGGELIAGAGGVVLLAALFLGWYSGASAWQAFSVLDVVLALLALVPLALVALQATRESPSLPVTFSVLTAVAGALAALLILYRILNQPGPNDARRGRARRLGRPRRRGVIAAGGWRSTARRGDPGRRAAADRGASRAHSLTDRLRRAARRRFTLGGKERSCPLSASCCCCWAPHSRRRRRTCRRTARSAGAPPRRPPAGSRW